MNKSELAGMEHDSRRGEAEQLLEPAVLALAVNGIAEQRESQVLEMDPDLMRAAGMQRGFHQRRAALRLEHAIAGARLPARAFAHRHAFAMGRMARDGGPDLTLIALHFAADDRVIDLPHRAPGELG